MAGGMDFISDIPEGLVGLSSASGTVDAFSDW